MERQKSASTDPTPAGKPASGAKLSELRQRADQYRQAARDAIERVKSQGETQRTLENLQNASGQ